MAISLLSSRVVLDKLGVEDFGIYNIVGSIVVSFAFMRYSMMESTQRFYSYRIGCGNSNCSKEFSASLNIHLVFIIIFLLLFETLGVWFLRCILNIPDERQHAAEIVLQLSIATFIINFIRIPHNALITANEKMSVYAYFSIIEAIFKLLILYLISSTNFDKLIIYSVLVLVSTIVINICYWAYCEIKLYESCRYSFQVDKQLLKEMFSFSSWNFVGGIATTIGNDAPNYLINVYLGVRVNAAMGIAKQVNGAVYGFFSSFQTAFNPQIVKAYADGDRDYLFQLIGKTSKLSFLLTSIITLPLVICIREVLNIWLTVVPDYTDQFCIIILISQLLFALSSPLQMVALAIGDIKRYQLIIGLITVSILPVSWLLLYLGTEPTYPIIYQAIINFFLIFFRFEYVHKKTGYPKARFYYDVVWKSLVFIPLIVVPVALRLSVLLSGIYKILLVSLYSLIAIPTAYLFICFSRNERQQIFRYIKHSDKSAHN